MCYTFRMQSRTGAVLQLIGVDLIGSVAWFPVWWYTKGFMRIIAMIRRAIDIRIRQYGFRIWLHNFFVPMYGQYSFTGRAVSLLMRAVVLVGRTIALGVEVLIYAGGLLIWVSAPALFVLLLLSHLVVHSLLGVV